MAFNNSFGLPGAYLGVRSPTPPNFQEYDRLPTPNDWQGYVEGAEWLYVPNKHMPTGRRLFILFSVAGNQALWVEVTSGGGTVVSLTGNDHVAVFPDGVGNINVVTNGSTVEVTGNPGTFTETINFALNNLLLGSDGATITSGIANVGLGLLALNLLSSGSFNTALGIGDLALLTTGNRNTAVGSEALSEITTTSDNTAIGADALINTTASLNTAVGSGSLSADTTGSNNIAIGYNAGSTITSSSNNIDIGNVGVVADSGVIRIGTNGTHTSTYMAGISGVSVANLNFVTINTATGQLGSEAGGGGGPITSVTTSNATPQFVLTGTVENINFGITNPKSHLIFLT